MLIDLLEHGSNNGILRAMLGLGPLLALALSL